MIKDILTMNIENDYFNRTLNEVNGDLKAKLPLNKDKNKNARTLTNEI